MIHVIRWYDDEQDYIDTQMVGKELKDRKDFDTNNVYVRAHPGTEGRYKAEKMLESYMMGYTGHDII